MKESMEIKPFLKWAGGKSQLVEQFKKLFPHELNGKGIIKNYFEPFLGGGAIFFWVAQNCKIEKYHLNEFNPDIYASYIVIKKSIATLIKTLSKLKKEYLELDEVQREAYYYRIRSEYNRNKKIFNVKRYNKKLWCARVAMTIFLNKTCFNGLYRVNSKGEFNVPWGRYKQPQIFSESNLLNINKLLQNAVITNDDFSIVEKNVLPDSFVYFDPPYRPLNKTASFNAYATTGFNDNEQKRLSKTFDYLNNMGVKVMLSNSDPKNIDPEDDFFDNIYKRYNIIRVEANRMINSNANNRGKIKELVIKNY